MRRDHNSTLPSPLSHGGREYGGPTELYRELHSPPSVGLARFCSRLMRLNRRGLLTEEAIADALYLGVESFRQKYGTRKTWITSDDNVRVDLQAYFDAHRHRASVDYRVFWSRLSRFRHRLEALERELLEHALTLSSADWVSFYGGGRHRSFIYYGEVYSEHEGKRFHGISSFLKTIGRFSDRSVIWSRLKAGWPLELALTIPVDIPEASKGLVYKLTRIKTGQVYVGLTTSSLDQRWAFHVSAAERGATTRLSQAIRSDGREGFVREVIEDNVETSAVLREREAYWQEQLDARGPHGLNMATPGSLGNRRGHEVEYEGEKFASINQASRTLSTRTKVAAHVVERCLRSGIPILQNPRRRSTHPDAGSPLFRRWLALCRRYPDSVALEWRESFDRFKADVGPEAPVGGVLLRVDPSMQWGSGNWKWGTRQDKVEESHGTSQRVHGLLFASLKAVAFHYGLGVSTLKDRIGRQGLTVEEAVLVPLGVTSCKRASARFTLEARSFRSKRQAVLYLAGKYGLTEGQARYRFEKGEYS